MGLMILALAAYATYAVNAARFIRKLRMARHDAAGQACPRPCPPVPAELAARAADVMAVDISPSLIEIALDRLATRRCEGVVVTVAPRTAFLMAFWTLGKAFPRRDRCPIMVPLALATLQKSSPHRISKTDRIARGFYIPDCLEIRA